MQIVLARALLLLTPCLMILGGFVHAIGASLACPDWPLCHQEVFPEMTGGVLYEHSHRLLASGIGLLTLALAGTTRSGTSALRPALAGWGVLLVVAQGLLGGLTVLLRLPAIVSIFHFTTSLVFLAWVVHVNMVVDHARLLATPGGNNLSPGLASPSLLRWLTAAVILLFTQLILGAVVRHVGASLACGLQAVACADGYVPTTWRGWLQTSHRLLALATWGTLTLATVQAVVWGRRSQLHQLASLRRWMGIVHVGLVLQIALGVWTLWSGVHPHVVTLHLLVGIVLWIGQLIIYQQCAWFGLQDFQHRTA